MNVYQKLDAAREEFHTLKLTKTGHNKFAGYNYFELGDFLIPALKTFRKHGLCGVVSFSAEIAQMRVVSTDKPEDFILIESPMGSASLKGCHEVQNIGAVETYQRRYLWVAALEIVEHDALDATTGKAEPEAKAKKYETSTLKLAAADEPVDPEDETFLNALAEEVTEVISKNRAGAYDLLQSQNLNNAQKMYLSLQLGSTISNQLKAERAARDKAEKATA